MMTSNEQPVLSNVIERARTDTLRFLLAVVDNYYQAPGDLSFADHFRAVTLTHLIFESFSKGKFYEVLKDLSTLVSIVASHRNGFSKKTTEAARRAGPRILIFKQFLSEFGELSKDQERDLAQVVRSFNELFLHERLFNG
jgi:hypothetical protein